MASPEARNGEPRIVQYFLDTRPLWHVNTAQGAKDSVQDLEIVAAHELQLLTETERASVLRFYHLRDAKMSLASHLLKHFIITKYGNASWPNSKVSREANGKPSFHTSNPEERRVDFNVSHQAGIVSLIAAVGFNEKIDVGTDVVCWNERVKHDYAHIERDGFFDWVDMHADVFANTEVGYMKLGHVDLGIGDTQGYSKDLISRCERRLGSIDVKIKEGDGEKVVRVEKSKIIDAKLRRFYAMWCLREAYVKMTGEALLAPWLKELEILDVRAPRPPDGVEDDIVLTAGEAVQDFKIIFKGGRVSNIALELSALGANYMIGGAARQLNGMNDQRLEMGEWKPLLLDEILNVAEDQ